MTWENKFENRPVTWSAKFIVGAVVFTLLLGWAVTAAVFGARVATAGIVGRGEAHVIKESAPNRIAQQAAFEQSFADVKAFQQKVADARKAVADWDAANGGRQDNAIGTLASQRAYLTQVVLGLQQQCINTVASYNAASHKYLAQDFRDSRLPYELRSEEYCK